MAVNASRLVMAGSCNSSRVITSGFFFGLGSTTRSSLSFACELAHADDRTIRTGRRTRVNLMVAPSVGKGRRTAVSLLGRQRGQHDDHWPSVGVDSEPVLSVVRVEIPNLDQAASIDLRQRVHRLQRAVVLG